jgi:serine/threonine protein kinase
MAVADVHPSAAELAAFILGTLDDETQASIEAHVATCRSCQERAATVPGDSFVELVRSVHARLAALADTELEAVQAHTPPPRPREAVSVAPSLAAPVGLDPANGLNAMPPELARHERYRVVRLLGEGGMGSVYEAEQLVMQRRVALKVIRRADTASPAALERFRREVRAAARLSHPNIVTAYDADTAGELHFLVMEYVEGITLAWLVKERGPLPIDEACDYVRQATLGLQHAHDRGLVHRDIKPDNLIRCSAGTVKILDFGLAALTAESGGGLTEANVVMGTPEYTAPEQAEDSHHADIRADLYSLGCTLCYLLTGEPPYPAPTPMLKVLVHRDRPVPSLRRARPDVPPELARVLERLLAKRPEDRYQTPRELAAALAPFAQPAPPPPKKQHRRLVAALAALLLVGVAIAGAVVYCIQTDKGELVIKTDNDDVEVVVSKGGEVVKIIDTKSGKHIALDSGDYELALKDGKEGLRLSPGKMTLKRGETKLATIERVTKPVAETIGEIRRFVGHEDAVFTATFSPDGATCVTASRDCTIRLWSVTTGKELQCFRGHEQGVYCARFLPNGKQIVSGSADSTVRLWDIESGQEVKQIKHGTKVGWVTVSPDGEGVVSCSHTDERAAIQMRLWDLKTGKEQKRFEGHTQQVVVAAFSRDGKRLLVGGHRAMRLWDVKSGKELLSYEVPHDCLAVLGVAFSPDDRRLLSCYQSLPFFSLWDVETGKPIRHFTGHRAPIHGVAFTADGRRALSGSLDGTVRLWDVETGRELHNFQGHGGVVWGVALSPDGRLALSASDDKTARLWRLPDLPPANENP